MRDWPVVVTNRCAQACAEDFGISHPASVRDWLYQVINQRGRLTKELPASAPKLKSRSGYFLVVNDVVVLPLMVSSDGTARWIATDCAVLPAYRRRIASTKDADPYRLTGTDLMRHVHLTRPAVDQFQQRCGGDPHHEIAREELHDILCRDARAVADPPAWSAAPEADFYLVAGDEYIVPVSRKRNGRYSFAALGCLHRVGALFTLRDADLVAYCRFDSATLRIEPQRWDRFVAAVTEGGRLSWRCPRWARPHPTARLWVVASATLAAPVAWQSCNNDRPLLILDIQERRRVLARVARWLPGSGRNAG